VLLHYWNLKLVLPRLCVSRHWNESNYRCHLPILEQSRTEKKEKRGWQQKNASEN
jgi:hypothetical protein